MKRLGAYLVVGILLVVGFILLLLANIGYVSLQKPYVVRQGTDLYPATSSVVTFVDVNIVPMDSERVLKGQTVIVRDGVIDRIGPVSTVEVPQNTLLVDGRGGYLLPGLTDMHTHIKNENQLLLFVANGVTTARDMWGAGGLDVSLGFPDQLKLRRQVQAGLLLGPTIYTAGPVMEGEPKTNPMMPVFRSEEEAIASVKQQKSEGYDFIKVYDQLTPEIYDAIVRTAREEGLQVVGHVPGKVGLEHVLESGQLTIEHLSGYIDPDSAQFLIPEDSLADYAKMTRDAGVWICPTIGVYQKHVSDADLDALEAQPVMAYVSPQMKILWRTLFRPGAMKNISYVGDYPGRIDEMFTRMTRVLHENGARFILGTDSGNPYVVHGSSLLDELDYLVKAGFTPYEALEAGTRSPAEVLGQADVFGTITEGKRADLILLTDNPLDNVTNIRSRSGVMVRGRWLPESQLQAMLDALQASYSPTFIERIWPITIIALAVYLLIRKRNASRS